MMTTHSRDFLKTIGLTLAASSGAGRRTLGADSHQTYSFIARPPGMKLGIVTYNIAKDWDVPTIIKNCTETEWKEAYEGAKQEMHADVPLVHQITELELPRREVTQREWELAKARVAELSQQKGVQINWYGEVVNRYERQQARMVEPYTMELHVIRLGDIAIATNPFGLFTAYAIQIKSRSPALQTFVIQLAGPGGSSRELSGKHPPKEPL